MPLLRTFQIYLFFLFALVFTACNRKKEADVSNIRLSLKVERFDQEFGKLSLQNLKLEAPLLQKKYKPFYNDYIEGMLGLGSTLDTTYYNNLRTVIQSQDYIALKEEVAAKYPDLKESEAELTEVFKHVKYYYPHQKTPRLISFISGFSVQTPIGENYIGIGLDMFLGPDSKFYPALRESIPLYISRKFTKQNIAPRVVETYIREEMFPEPDNLNTFLDRIIYNGKMLYMMDALMPNLPDSLKINYTAAQMQWCQEYETQIWGYFLEENLLYETDYMKIQKYLTEAPFTPGIGEKNESAPKLGIYIGWQIVKKYMEKNGDVSLQELMKNTNYQEILTRSKYKPK